MRLTVRLSHETQLHPLGYLTSFANTTNGVFPFFGLATLHVANS